MMPMETEVNGCSESAYFSSKFEIYKNSSYIGCLDKEFSFLTPHYNVDYNGWHIIDGTIMEWDYSILDQAVIQFAQVSKNCFHMTDTYVIDVCRIQMHWMR